MIDWQATFEMYGYGETDKIPKYQKVVLRCDECNEPKQNTKHYHYRAIRRTGHYRCRECANKLMRGKPNEAVKKKWQDSKYRCKQESRTHTDDLKSQARARSLNLWEDQQYIDKFWESFDPVVAKRNLESANNAALTSARLSKMWSDDKYREHMSEQSRRLWQDESYRNQIRSSLIQHYDNPEVRALASERSYKVWDNPKSRRKLSRSLQDKWNDDQYRHKCALARSKKQTTSSYEDVVANVLDGFNIDYERQYVIGPWTFDFYLPRSDTLIEVNGFYHHQNRIALDKAKSTYVDRHTSCKFLVISESDLLAEYKIRSLFERSVDINTINFNNLLCEQCHRKDIINFLASYHYMGKPNRGGRYFRSTYDGVTIAAAIMSPVHRIEVATSIGADPKRTIEISRFAIHPQYQIKNLASWTIARLRKWAIEAGFDTLVAFADTSLHTGTIYKASGFNCAGSSRNKDYAYIDNDGFRLHKKTVWDHAKRNRIKERKYAAKMGLTKVIVASRVKYVWQVPGST